MTVENLIHLFFDLVGYLSGVLPIVNAFTTIFNFVSNVASFVPDFTNYIGYVYYFIPKNILAPLIVVSTACLNFRICMGVVNLIWW